MKYNKRNYTEDILAEIAKKSINIEIKSLYQWIKKKRKEHQWGTLLS